MEARAGRREVKFDRLRTRAAKLQLSAAMRIAGLSYAKDLPEEHVTDLRIIGSLFRILDRRPAGQDDGLDHVVESVVARSASIGASKLVAACAYYLCDDAIRAYREIGVGQVPPVLSTLAGSCDLVTRRSDSTRLVILFTSLTDEFQAADPEVIAAIARAIGSSCARPHPEPGELSPSLALSLAAHAALEKGQDGLAGQLSSQLEQLAESDGYRAIAAMTYAPTVRTGTDEEYHEAIEQANQAAYGLSPDDPARQIAAIIADGKRNQWSGADDELRSPSQRSFAEGTRLMRAGDRAQAAIAFDLAADEAARRTGEPAIDALYRGRAAIMSFLNRFNSIYDSPDYPSAELAAILARLTSHDFAAARNQYPFSDALRNLLKYCAARAEDESYAWLAAIAAELRGDYDGGLAIGSQLVTREAADVASRELAVKDLLTGFIQLSSPDSLRAAAAAQTVIWVSEVIDNGEQGVVSIMLGPGDDTPRVFPTIVRSDRGRGLMERATAAQLNDFDAQAADDIATLRQWIFRQEVDPALPVMIIPDRRLWCLPWAAIVPPGVAAMTLAPSLSATTRLAGHLPRPRVPVIAGVFDPELRGAKEELKALEKLHAEGKVILRRADSLAELKYILTGGQIDLLTIAAHGTSSDGFEYRLLFPESAASPAGLLGLPLPPNVVLGCCWSARQGAMADAVATALACMSAGASSVVGALWAVNDWQAGKILASAYPDFAAGMSLSRAIRAAYLRRAGLVAGAALAVLGLPE